MNREQVDFELQVRVRRYLEYIFMEAKNEKTEEEQTIISLLSNNLRRELLMQTNGKLLCSTPIFLNNFSKGTLEKLSELMVQQDFAHEEVVFEVRIAIYVYVYEERELPLSSEVYKTIIKIINLLLCIVLRATGLRGNYNPLGDNDAYFKQTDLNKKVMSFLFLFFQSISSIFVFLF